MCDGKNKYDYDSAGHTYGRQYKGGWDIDTSDKTQRESDGGHIPGRYQWEETVDVSADLFDDNDDDSNNDDNDSNNDGDDNN